MIIVCSLIAIIMNASIGFFPLTFGTIYSVYF